MRWLGTCGKDNPSAWRGKCWPHEAPSLAAVARSDEFRPALPDHQALELQPLLLEAIAAVEGVDMIAYGHSDLISSPAITAHSVMAAEQAQARLKSIGVPVP